MNEIVKSIQDVTAIMGQIAVASEAQTDGIQRVNGAIGEMNQVTQQNAALVEEAAAGARALQEQAARLEDTVRVFKLARPTDLPTAPDF